MIIIILSAGSGRLILHELNVIKGQQKMIIESLNTLVGTKLGNASPSCTVKDTEFSDLLKMLPISSYEGLKQVEDKLKNQDTAHKMVSI